MAEIPTNLEEAVTALRELIPQEQLDEFAAWDRDEAGNRGHHTLGQWIRNHWGLWKGGPLKEWFEKEIHAQHPDDMSSIILDALWSDLNFVPRTTVELLAKYRAHWKHQKERG